MEVLEMKHESEKSAFKIVETRIKEQVSESISKLTSEKEILEGEIESIKQDIQKLNSLLNSKEQKVQEIASSIFLEQSKCNELVEKEIQKIANLEKELKKMATGIKKLQKTQTKLQKEIKDKEIFLSKLNELQTELEKEITTEKHILDSKTEILIEQAAKRTKIESSSNSFEEMDKRIESLNEEKFILSKKCEDTKILIQNIKNKLNIFNEEKNSLVSSKNFQEAANISIKLKNTQEDLETLETNLNTFQSELDNIEERLSQAKEARNQLAKDIKKRKQALEQPKYKMIEVKIEELKYLSNIVKKIHENDKRYLIVLRKQINAYESQVNEIKENLGLLEPNKELTMSEIAKISDKKAQLELELEKLVQAEEYDKAAQLQLKLENIEESIKLNGTEMS